MAITIHATTDDEERAKQIADRLRREEHAKASVMRVTDMHFFRMPEAPRTTNRYAVVIER